jgi:N-acetylmuramoyl-L-alanine amidase
MQILHQIHSKNYDLRPKARNPIKYVIIHYTELNFDDSVNILCSQASKVSAHYLIRKDGAVFQLVGDFYRAWHAGKSKWKGQESLNNNSIGIEIENLGNEEFKDEQYKSLVELCKILKNKYNIDQNDFIGHSDIATNRKIDPGIFFNWKKLLKYNLGISFRNSDESYKKIDLKPKNIINLRLSLSKIGYDIDISDENYTKDLSDTIRAFQLHFSPHSIEMQGGLGYLKNLDNNFNWDSLSQTALDNIQKLNIL